MSLSRRWPFLLPEADNRFRWRGQGLERESDQCGDSESINPAAAQRIGAANQAATEAAGEISMDRVSSAITESSEESKSESENENGGGDSAEEGNEGDSEDQGDANTLREIRGGLLPEPPRPWRQQGLDCLEKVEIGQIHQVTRHARFDPKADCTVLPVVGSPRTPWLWKTEAWLSAC